jgi:hypothetical protein
VVQELVACLPLICTVCRKVFRSVWLPKKWHPILRSVYASLLWRQLLLHCGKPSSIWDPGWQKQTPLTQDMFTRAHWRSSKHCPQTFSTGSESIVWGLWRLQIYLTLWP